jgi:hypothetical protein
MFATISDPSTSRPLIVKMDGITSLFLCFALFAIAYCCCCYCTLWRYGGIEIYDLKGRKPKGKREAPAKGAIWKDHHLNRTFHLKGSLFRSCFSNNPLTFASSCYL